MGRIKNTKILGAGVLAINMFNGEILLGRRGMGGDNPNCWSSFGGTFEDIDKTPFKTAQREFFEETNCVTPYKISKKPYYINNDNFLTFYTYLGLFEGRPKIQINEESLSYGWFKLDNLPDNLLPGFSDLIQEKRGELEYFISKNITR
jgi:8-oxo-dGTP pyrophosphatase MutT (NUDIX family)